MINAKELATNICNHIEIYKAKAAKRDQHISGKDLVDMICEKKGISLNNVKSVKTRTYGLPATYYLIPITGEDGSKSGVVIDEHGGNQPQEAIPEDLKQDLGIIKPAPLH